jgi:hypothetical protein
MFPWFTWYKTKGNRKFHPNRFVVELRESIFT